MKEQKVKKKAKTLPIRMNIFFAIVFLLFTVIIFRLGYMQIVQGDQYKRKLEQSENITVNTSLPRGQIYDSTHKLIAGNKGLKAITYTRPNKVTSEQMIKVATNLAKIINLDSKTDLKEITVRDKQDFWILLNKKAAEKLITIKDQEAVKGKKDAQARLYQLQLSRIPKEELNFSKETLEVLGIYRKMSTGTKLTPQIIKNQGVTTDEYAYVSENLDKLPGVDTTTDWERYNAFSTKEDSGVLSSILGKVSTSKEGLPKELQNYYLAKGYKNNDRVGKSYLEFQYEDVLQGKKEQVKNVPDAKGNITSSSTVSKGRRGDDLVLAIDVDLQKKVDNIVSKLSKYEIEGSKYQKYSDRAFVTVMDPHTGEVLAMSGKQWLKNKDTGKYEMEDYALGNISSAYQVGSVAKPATLLTGYHTGAINFGEQFQDNGQLKFAGTPAKKSWKNLNASLTDLTALARSSNVYMWRVAMAIGGQNNYHPEIKININKDKLVDTFRQNFNELGLGVKTGIDLPGEMAGYIGPYPDNPGTAIDFAIGQFDTYTPLQLAQYVSTIANGGKRMEPHIVKSILSPSTDPQTLGSIEKEIAPKILNTVDFSKAELDRVKQGMVEVVHSPIGTATNHFPLSNTKNYKVAGKTGTAQSGYQGERSNNKYTDDNIWNETFVGYAPYDDPQVAISVVVPYTDSETHANLAIADRVFDAYFKLKSKELKSDKK